VNAPAGGAARPSAPGEIAPAGGTIAERLGDVQIALREAGREGWLLYDHRGINGLAVRALGLEDAAPTRRLFYWVPADGMPALVAHATEIQAFGELPGDVLPYDSWSSFRARLEKILPRRGLVAMEHEDVGGNPDLSRVDGGTVALVSSYGPRVVSSADLANALLGPWTEAQAAAHARALVRVLEAEAEVVSFLAIERTPLESEVCAVADAALLRRGLVPGRSSAVASGPHTRDGHHRPRHERDRRLLPRDVVTIDLVARDAERAAPFVHRGLVASLEEPEPAHVEAFAVARRARDSAVALVRERARSGQRLLGFEVDEHARRLLGRSGQVVHRTAHHLGRIPFSAEACTFDAFEIHDTREAVAGLAWSIHPGLYREDFGLRATASVRSVGGDVQLLDPGQTEIRVVARGAR